MKSLTLLITLMFLIGCTTAQRKIASIDDLYVKTYGNASKTPIIFIHGGPGFDSQVFEYSTAQKLSEAGFYVVVYDQRGQGRSAIATKPEIYNYKTYADDIKEIISVYGLKNPILLGHSHGGPIAIKFDEYYPGVVKSILLVSAPVEFPQSLRSILKNCSSRYKKTKKTSELKDLENVFANLSKTPLELIVEVQNTFLAFQHGIKCGLYQPQSPTAESKSLKELVGKSYVNPAPENLQYPMFNFIVYEKYSRLDHTTAVQKNSKHIFGIYGEEDGLFTPEILSKIDTTLKDNPSSKRFQLIKKASHDVYMDQQAEFIDAVKTVAQEN
jgi:proline iminopeptidase